jgi:DNA-directed RNA polymerase subunit RPC12/RpoP
MSEPRPRRTLSLSPAAAKALAARSAEWICKPCGSRFKLPPKITQDEGVRCPSCGANLGRAIGFLNPEAATAKVRARPASVETP